ncbi:hypothetical protein JW859_02945 [bacterium]|nr:hypothetical protein [bacterium]
MLLLRYFLLVIVVLALAGCQSASLSRDINVAGSEEDVISSWNNWCATYNFDTVPGGAGVLVGSVYYGNDFDSDADGLLRIIQLEVNSTGRPDIDETEFLSCVISDPAWYE